MQFEHDGVDNLDSNDNSNENRAAGQAQAQSSALGGGVAAAGVSGAIAGDGEPNPYAGSNISRNALCPCGSGLKYKQCHGKI